MCRNVLGRDTEAHIAPGGYWLPLVFEWDCESKVVWALKEGRYTCTPFTVHPSSHNLWGSGHRPRVLVWNSMPLLLAQLGLY